MRNGLGKVVLAASFFYAECSNTIAEFRALCDGLRLILQYGLSGYGVLIECDSLILVKSVLGAGSCPWICLELLSQIRVSLQNLNFQIGHIFREANGVADRLAAYAILKQRTEDFSMDLQLPCDVRVALSNDQLGLPVLRKRRRLVFDDKG